MTRRGRQRRAVENDVETQGLAKPVPPAMHLLRMELDQREGSRFWGEWPRMQETALDLHFLVLSWERSIVVARERLASARRVLCHTTLSPIITVTLGIAGGRAIS